MKKILLLLACSFACSYLNAQEFLFPLSINKELAKSKPASYNLSRMASSDTLLLPFLDDFSRPGMYPFDSLWLDSGVYINNNYSRLPVTIGIATFDGLNAFGKPYQPGSNIDSVADILTSRPLDLVVPPGDTSVWMSFFYQPQGLGDLPESGDSLVLQFKDTGNTWQTVWAANGRSDTAFQRVNIRISDPIYLYRGFQFRFYNIATVNGNRDHWNLDYVTLLKNTIANAPILDNVLIRPQSSLLTEYSAMPYPHYKALSSQQAAMKTVVEDTIYNINYGPTTYVPGVSISQDGVSLFNNTTLTSTATSPAFVPHSLPLNNFTFPVHSGDSADFLIRSYIDLHGFEANSFNDTSYYYQRFHNYYAYDDGSAELAYGLSGSQDVSLAVQFDVKMADTLRGVQIYFNPTGTNVANKLFQLTAWSEINVANNNSTEIYRLINQKPDTFDGINAFKTYRFDVDIPVSPGPIWVGFIQNEPMTLYGVGFDKNTDSHTKAFYRLAGFWQQSVIPGSLMIRPIFGSKITYTSMDDNMNEGPSFSLWPNPAANSFYISVEQNFQKRFTYRIYDCMGSIVLEGEHSNGKAISTTGLSGGIYFVRMFDAENRTSSVQRLVVQ